jgi:hypothetical protein
MSHEYNGVSSYPITITIPDDGDLDAAAAYAVAFQQLADRTTALTGGGVGVDFTDAHFHGASTFADGTIAATVTSMDVNATGDVFIAAGGTLGLGAAGATTINGGVVTIDASGIILGAHVTLGSGPSDTIEVRGVLSCLANATFPAGKNLTLAGATYAPPASSVTVAGVLDVQGPMRNATNNTPPVSTTIDGTMGYEHVFTNAATGDVSINLTHTGAARGQRIRFNAQQVTGLFDYQILYGPQQWFMRNLAGKTVVLEFVSNGFGWVVDQWEPGGVALRNGG